MLFPALAYGQQNTAQVIPTRDKLLNGLPVVILPRPGSGSVAIHIVIKSGATFDLLNKAGLADLTAQMISRGTASFTSEQLRDELQEYGLRLEVNAYWDSTEIRMLGSGSKLEKMLEILNQIITQPKFPMTEIEQLKAERIKALEASAANADDNFYYSLYGSHPYGHSILGTKASITKITRSDIVDFYSRCYLANNSVLVLAGDVNLDRALPELKKGLGGWRKGAVPPYTFVPPTVASGLSVRLKEDTNLANSEIRLGYTSLKHTDSDYLSAKLLTNILNDRLAKTPELKAQATLSARKLIGTFLVSAVSANTTSSETINTLIDQIKKLSTIDATELQKAKDKLQEEYYTDISTNTVLAARWAEVENYNFGSNYIKDFSLIVSRISLENLQQVAAKHLSPENLIITVTGKSSELEPSLKKLGKVEVIK